MLSTTLGGKPKDPDFIVLGRLPYSCGHASTIGVRDSMEDCSVVVGDFAGPGTSYFAVYDGHGGSGVARYCANYFHKIFSQKYHDTANVFALIKETILELNKVAIKKWPNFEIAETVPAEQSVGPSSWL